MKSRTAPVEVNKPVKPASREEAYGGQTKEQAMRQAELRSQPVSLTKLQKTYREVCSNLSAYTGGGKTCVGNKVSVTLREDGSWLAVLAFDDIDTLERMVGFGSGETFEGALAGLSKALAAGRVKVNKPYLPK